MTPNRLILPIHTSCWKRNSLRQLEKYIDFTYFRNSKGLMNQGAFQPYAFHVLVQLEVIAWPIFSGMSPCIYQGFQALSFSFEIIKDVTLGRTI